uniref:Uncharacterized protein n=1 Tax=Anguilla anguilla TaxID=7936 RepID=A0A0E9TPP3_ANGAN
MSAFSGVFFTMMMSFPLLLLTRVGEIFDFC